MEFIVGFLVWSALGVIAGVAVRTLYRVDSTVAILTVVFGLFGAFIGGMLGTSPYIHHNPVPLRLGGLLGAALGAFSFSFLYHFIARKVV